MSMLPRTRHLDCINTENYAENIIYRNKGVDLKNLFPA